MDTQTQIDRLIELAIVQRSDLKKLISELPQLREHLNAEIERIFEDSEPQIRAELEDWTTKQAKDETAKLGSQLEAKLTSLSKSLEATTQTRYNAIMAERAQNIDLAKKAEDKLAEVAQAIPVQVKQIVTDELARFPRAGEIDQLRKEFAEPRGLNPRGRWEPGATYYKLDLVAYNGDSYVANEETSEKPNRNSSKWTLNAARGQAGGGGFITPAQGDYTASMITNVPAGTIAATNVQDAINELAADVDVSQNTLDALVTNAESVAITKGQVVYAFGSVGNRMSVKLALNTGDATSAKTIGVVLDSSIAAGAIGNIRCVGVVDKLTLGSYTEGDTVYLGATAGSITATKPYAPNHLVYVGIVERANNGNGELYVKIQNGYELDEIHDVQITSAPLAGALLMRDATNSLWKANRLTGTTNQVTVTNADTAVTLSLPTSLASVDSITASASTALTLTGGSTGASLVLGATTGGVSTLTAGSAATGYANKIFRVLSGAGTAHLTATGDGRVYVGPDVATNSFLSIRRSTGNSVNEMLSLNDADAFTTTFYYPNSTTFGARIAGSVGSFQWGNSGVSSSQLNLNTSTGNLLIGTTTDAASLAGGLVVNGSGAGAAASSTTTGALRVTGGVGVSGAGWFGGPINAVGGQVTGTFTVGNGTAAAVSAINRGTTSQGAYVQWATAGTPNWAAGPGATGTNTNWELYNYGIGANALSISNATSAATFAGAVNVAGVLSGTGTNTWAMQSVGASGALVAGGWLYGINNGFNITPNGAGVAGATFMLAAFDGTGYREMLSTANVASGASTLRLAGYGGPTTVGGGITVSGVANVTNTTSASSSTVGALTIGNGSAATNVAIGGGNINAGGTLTVASSVAGTAPINGSNSSAVATPNLTSLLAASTTASGATNTGPYMSVGVANSIYNSAVVQFGYVGASNAANLLQLGLYSAPPVTINGVGAMSIPSTTASTGSTSGALQVAGGIGTNNLSAFKSLLLSYDTGQYNSDATLSNYSATNGVYLNGNAGGWLRLVGSGGGAAQIQLNGGAAGAITMNTATANALVLNGATGAATFAGAVTANGQLIAKGTATNDSAATGYIGEYVSSTIASGSAVSLTTATNANITSISLTAGDWDVDGNVLFVPQVATVRQRSIVSISTTSATRTADETDATVTYNTADANANTYSVPSLTRRLSINATTTVYLVTRADFISGTQSAYGVIRARRVR